MTIVHTARKIVLKGAPRQDEAVAAGAIKPGQLIKLNSADKAVVHATEGGNGEIAFAVEDAYLGKSIDTAYASGDRVHYVLPQAGDEVAAYVGTGKTIALNDLLYSAGDGNLTNTVAPAVTNPHPIAVAREAIDTTDTGAVADRIRVRVL